MRVFLHAGVHRTGTTSLQTFLSANRVALALRGVAYPGDRVHHQHFASGLKSGKTSAADLGAEIEAAVGARQVVFSAEDFAGLTDLGWLAELAARYPVQVQFYLRRQDHWVMSWYNQHIKWPFHRWKSKMGPRAFLDAIDEFHWLDYAALVARWAAVLGDERVGVAVVEPGQVQDVRDDFLARLGVTGDGLDRAAGRLNDSLPVHMLEIARHLGLWEMPPPQRNRVLRALREGLDDKTPPAKTVFSPAQRHAILERFAVSNRTLAERYFGRSELFLEPPPAPDEPYFEFPDPSREELMREWVAPVIRALLKEPR